MDTTGEQARRSICDDIGARLDCSTGLKILCCLWLVPGVALTWIGLVALGIRTPGSGVARGSLEKIQAMSVMLIIFTVVVAAMWTIRVCDVLPAYRRPLRGRTLHRRSPEARLAQVGLAGAIVGAGAIARTVNDPTPWLTIAAWAGFFLTVGLLRPLATAPVVRPYVLMAFAAACLYQVTVGWIHVLDPTGPFAVTVVAQGLVLAWTATAAAREVGVTQRAVRFGLADRSVSREQVRRPLAEPAVGH
ncbi:MAG: hypothetical protein AAGA65_04670 [Actinomycetota bacterium]